MAERIYRETMLLRTCNCDVAGYWRPSAILELMQEAAGVHAELLGIGRSTLFPQGMVWIISRVEVKMDRFPRVGERVTIETFPMPLRRWFFPRYFRFYDEQGIEIGRAGSLWLLLDWNTRRMAKPDAVAALMPDNSDLTAPLGMPPTVAEVDGPIMEANYMPQYTDLDVNLHVNNTKYMDICCNALGVEIMLKYCMPTFAVNYSQEVRPGQTLRTQLRVKDGAFSFSGSEGDVRHFDVGGQLVLRED